MQTVSGEQCGTGSAGEQNTLGICSSGFHEVRARSSSPSTHRAVTSPRCCLRPGSESDQQGRGTATPRNNVFMEVVSSHCPKLSEAHADINSSVLVTGRVTLAGYFLSCALEVGSDAPASSAVLQNINCPLLILLSDDLLYF